MTLSNLLRQYSSYSANFFRPFHRSLLPLGSLSKVWSKGNPLKIFPILLLFINLSFKISDSIKTTSNLHRTRLLLLIIVHLKLIIVIIIITIERIILITTTFTFSILCSTSKAKLIATSTGNMVTSFIFLNPKFTTWTLLHLCTFSKFRKIFFIFRQLFNL